MRFGKRLSLRLKFVPKNNDINSAVVYCKLNEIPSYILIRIKTSVNQPLNMNKAMELDVWKGDWGLPSIDLDCLETLAFIKFAGVSVKVNQKSNPFWTPTGTLPVFKHNKQKLTNIEDISNHLKKKNFSPDFALNNRQTADVVAFRSMIKEQLYPALLYLWWVDEKSYVGVTRPWFCKVLPFPLNFHYPNKYKAKATDLIEALFTDTGVIDNHVVQTELFAQAERCLATLSARLGDREFFFGAQPTSLDALVYAHLALLLRPPLPPSPLHSYAASAACLNLQRLVTRISQRYFSHHHHEYEEKQKKLREENAPGAGSGRFKATDKVFATLFAALAMVMYAIAKGFIQEGKERNDPDTINFPECAQVRARLLQIQDYIQQTSQVMLQLKLAGTPEHMEKFQKLAEMLEGLKDSEVKLTAILKTFDKLEDKQTPDVTMGQADETTPEGNSQPSSQVQETSAADSRSCLNEISKLQNRLRELQLKKAQMDQIVQQFSSLEKSIDREEEHSTDTETDGSVKMKDSTGSTMEDKAAELALLKAQLSQMQSLICGLGQNSSQSINIEEEKDESFSDENVNSEQTNGYADDESLQRLKVKSLALSDAKAKLSRMKELLTLVEDLRSVGKPVPSRVIALLNSDEGPLGTEQASFMDLSDESLQEICAELTAAATAIDTETDSQRQKNKIALVDDSNPKRHKSGEE